MDRRPAAATAEAPEQTLSTQDWIDAARRMLIRDGIGALKIDRLARECGVTRGGFYWRFKSRGDLLAKLLDEWRNVNTQPLTEALRGPGTPAARLKRTFLLWVAEEAFDPMFDTAVRAWAATSKSVAAMVREVDDARIQALQDLFLDAADPDVEALVRARIIYFHQVGYYAMGIHEAQQRRHDLLPHYFKVLSGFDWQATEA